MTDVLTLPEAEALAERILDAIDASSPLNTRLDFRNADRERIASDLAGLREHYGVGRMADARRYSDGLRRTAALYGCEEKR